MTQSEKNRRKKGRWCGRVAESNSDLRKVLVDCHVSEAHQRIPIPTDILSYFSFTEWNSWKEEWL
jgi:hypothetical protein